MGSTGTEYPPTFSFSLRMVRPFRSGFGGAGFYLQPQLPPQLQSVELNVMCASSH